MKKKRVAILMGGPSQEFGTSLKSGEYVLDLLDKEKYEPTGVFVDREGDWDISPEEIKKTADLAFISLHGNYGEDGTVQSILDMHGIPYTGSRAMHSALCMNKFLSLQVLADAEVSVPHTIHIHKKEYKEDKKFVLKTITERVGSPAVVKPNRSGSLIGVSLVKNTAGIGEALEHVFSLTSEAIVQKYIKGREFTCGVLDRGWPESAYPFLPVEIISHGVSFSKSSMQVVPPKNLSPAKIKEIQNIALVTHRRSGASGCSKTDMIMDVGGNIFVLEINTIPEFGHDSVILSAAKASGISPQEFLDTLIEGAMHHDSKKWKVYNI